jgi:EF hand
MGRGVPVLISVVIGVAAGLVTAAAGAQQLPSSCHGGPDGSVSAQDAGGRAEERFDRARQGAAGHGEQQLAAALPGAEGLRRQFIQADDDGDGRISRDEWLRSFGPAHAGLAAGAGSRSSGTD